jgi:hypothetical protein
MDGATARTRARRVGTPSDFRPAQGSSIAVRNEVRSTFTITIKADHRIVPVNDEREWNRIDLSFDITNYTNGGQVVRLNSSANLLVDDSVFIDPADLKRIAQLL